MIKLNNIQKSYLADQEWLPVLKGITLEIEQGDFVAIMGPSGSGKSTLLNLMGFIDRHYQGEYRVDNVLMSSKNDKELSVLRNKKVGFVFQGFNLIESLTVQENLELPLLYNGYKYSETKEKVVHLLQKMGIEDKLDKYPKQLSGGQQQRAAIARAMINNPEFILADEPTGALDSVTSEDIMTLFKQINEEEGVTIILVTHDPETVNYCNRVIRMQDGLLLEEARA
jgi:putative ABC transport system ATP-binding protein